MINGRKYIIVVKSYFDFLVTEFGFKPLEEIVNGNFFYDVIFKDETKSVSISYENIEDYLQIIVFILQQGHMPDYNDKTKTLHLNQLNTIVLSQVTKEEIYINNEHFINLKASDELERKLLKSAKELRLCLKYFDKL